MSTDPRTAAEVKFYDVAAHRMHEKACSTANMYGNPHSWLFAQWNKTFDGWIRTAEHRRLDVKQFGKVQHIRYNLDGSVRELITY
jgi:hypothetical protein